MLTLSQKEKLYIPILASAFANRGFDPEFGVAIARQESALDPECKNLGPGDRERGGAWGLCQVTLRTAHDLGHKAITSVDLLDPATNASIAAELCSVNAERLIGCTYSYVNGYYEDLAAMYNSGRRYSKAPWTTQSNYVPRVIGFMAAYKAACVAYKVQPKNA